VKLAHRHFRRADQTLDPALGAEKVYFVDEPLWYLRLTSCLRLSWRRELATVTAVFGLGVALGLLLGRL
jgi:hypothetical protein